MISSKLRLIRRFATQAPGISSPSPGIEKYKIVVLGGGSGGLAVSANLASQHADLLQKVTKESDVASIAIIEPSEYHYYQPLWTLVGGGLKRFEDSRKSMKDMVSPLEKPLNGRQCKLLQARASQIMANDNCVQLADGRQIFYDYLVVAAGLECLWNKTPGLAEAIENPDSDVTSNYHLDAVCRTSDMIDKFKGGNAIFTQPSCPIKCAGAPQKIMYLAGERWRLAFMRDRSKYDISFMSGMNKIFSVDKYAEKLMKICHDRGITVNLGQDLVEVDSAKRSATFKMLDGSDEHRTVDYDFLHVTPFMGPPEFIRKSDLGNEAGWLNVDQHTLQNPEYGNIFALGDCSSVPTSKTASAVAAQSGALLNNLTKQIETDHVQGTAPGLANVAPAELKKYDGYTACPIVTGRASLMMAEFSGFDLQPKETFWFDQSEESMLMSVVNSDILPIVYWDVMTKGNWQGPEPYRSVFNPKNKN